jgi:hypothetical protein
MFFNEQNCQDQCKIDPDKDYNAYKDFFTRETEGHIIAKWMLFAGIDDLKGKY